MIPVQTLLDAAMMSAGLALTTCALYLIDRARRCELSVRTAVAVLLATEGICAVAVGAQAGGTWPLVICAVMSAGAAWIVIGTRYGRRFASIDTWGITAPDQLQELETAHDRSAS